MYTDCLARQTEPHWEHHWLLGFDTLEATYLDTLEGLVTMLEAINIKALDNTNLNMLDIIDSDMLDRLEPGDHAEDHGSEHTGQHQSWRTQWAKDGKECPGQLATLLMHGVSLLHFLISTLAQHNTKNSTNLNT